MAGKRKRSVERAKARLERMLRRERELLEEGCRMLAGVDEAGVGPLAGPVVAAAVVFEPGTGLEGVNDSKKLTPDRRAELAGLIRTTAIAWAVEEVQPEEIDRLNIYRATLEAMRRAVMGLGIEPDRVLVDARTIPHLPYPQEAIVRGDASCHSIAAASILAKTARDERMAELDTRYPGYGFATHKGYPTEAHRDAIRRLGPCPVHRRSFTLLPHRRLWE
jgi:ribonuclease HII